MKNKISKKVSSISNISQISNNSQINKKQKINSTYSKSPKDLMKLHKNKKNLSATASANVPKKTKQKYNILIIWIEQKKSVNYKKYEKIFSKIEYGPNSFKEINFVIKFLVFLINKIN
jgi:hypothetical protein